MAVTVVRYADEPAAVVRRREAGELVVEAIPADDVPAWVLERDERGSPAGRRARRGRPAERRSSSAASHSSTRPVSAASTPAHAAATLAFLPSADALVFVTDASAELSGPGARVPRERRCAPDRRSWWRSPRSTCTRSGGGSSRSTSGISGAIGSRATRRSRVSSVLRMAARSRWATRRLETESGFPAFAEALVGRRRRARQGRWPVGRDRAGRPRDRPAARAARGRADGPRAPRDAERMAADLRDVRAPLCRRSADADASWSVRLEDEFAALRTRTDLRVPGPDAAARPRTPRTSSSGSTRPTTWPEVSQRVQARTAAAVRGAFLEATDGAADDPGARSRACSPTRRSASTATGVADVVRRHRRCGRAGRRSTGGRRRDVVASLGIWSAGRAVGIEMLGMLGTLLGAAVVGPAVLGVAACSAARRSSSERRRQLADRRQQARTFLGGFVGGGPVRGRRPARVAARRGPAPDARPVRGPDPGAASDVHGECGGAGAGRRTGGGRTATRLPIVRAELEALEALRGRRWSSRRAAPADGGCRPGFSPIRHRGWH